MSIIHKVVYYLNDVLVSLDITPIQNTSKPKNSNNTTTSNTKVNN